MNKSPICKNKKRKGGFTLVEIICVVVLLGLFGSIGVALMRDTASTGRTNVLAKNASELNNATNNLRAAGASFVAGTAAVTQGSATAPATITLPAVPTAAAAAVFIAQLESTTGIRSMGITAQLGHSITDASYIYALDANNIPVWTVAAGTNLVP